LFSNKSHKCNKCKEIVDIHPQLKQVLGTIKRKIKEKQGKEKSVWINHGIIFDLITNLSVSLIDISDFLRRNSFKMSHSPAFIKKRLNTVCEESGLYSFDEMRSKLTIEKLPYETKSVNLHTGPFYSSSKNSLCNRIRKKIIEKAEGNCELCGSQKILNCHEVWQFSEHNATQRLVGFIALCQMCHLVKHQTYNDLGGIPWEDALRHVAEVNNWSILKARKYIDDQIGIQARRCHKL